jgi:DNA-binding response OmpR family regulator
MKRRAHAHKPKTVLIAEDDEAMGHLVAEALQEAGFHPHWVSDGIEALNFILQSKPDIVVLDLNLPRLPGYEICSMLRKAVPVRHTPVIVMSGLSHWDNKLQAFELGADDYVTKPFHMDELVARVEAVLRRTRFSHQPTPFLSHGLAA